MTPFFDPRVGLWVFEGRKVFEAHATVQRLKESPAALFLVLLKPGESRGMGDDESQVLYFQGQDLEAFRSFLVQNFSSLDRASLLKTAYIFQDLQATESERRMWDEFRSTIQQQADLQIQMAGHLSDSMIGFKHLCQNISHWAELPAASDYFGSAEGFPAVVVSTGPSLNGQIESLKKIQDSAIVIAADASLKVLRAADIDPHFVCSIERDLTTLAFFENYQPLSHWPKLLAYPEVPPQVVKAYLGPQIGIFRTYHSHAYFDSFLKKGRLRSGHSVAHLCLAWAEALGANPIYLVGQDLSFDPDSLATHSKNTAYADWEKPRSIDELKKQIEAEGDQLWWGKNYRKEPVPSRIYYRAFAHQLSAQAANMKADVYNAWDGGLVIPGIDYQPLSTIPADSGSLARLAKQWEASNTGSSASPDLNSLWHALEGRRNLYQAGIKMLAGSSKDLASLESLRRDWLHWMQDDVSRAFVFGMAGSEFLKLDVQWREACLEPSSENSLHTILCSFLELSLKVTDAVMAEIKNISSQ
jgi:hypothetical protein